MTLIISVATTKHAIQVADRRRTAFSGNQVVAIDDRANKVTVVYCKGARVGIASTGMGMIKNLTADEWLVECADSIPYAQRDLQALQKRIREWAGRDIRDMAISKDQLQFSTLTFVLIGFTTTGGAFVNLVSNALGPKGRRLDGPRPSFSTWPHLVTGGARAVKIDIHGSTSAVTKQVKTRLALLKKQGFFLNEEPGAISQELASLIRQCSEHPQHGRYIGRDCVGIAVTSDNLSEFIATCHSESSDLEMYAPNIVAENVAIKGIDGRLPGPFRCTFGADGKTLIQVWSQGALTAWLRRNKEAQADSA